MTSSKQDIQDAEIVPTTIGQYVHGKFGYWARRYVGMIALTAVVVAPIQMRNYGFEWWRVWAALGGWAICTTIALVVILLTLTAGGWWHTRRYRNH